MTTPASTPSTGTGVAPAAGRPKILVSGARAAAGLPADVVVLTCDAREPGSARSVLDLLLTDISRRPT
jgi:hypothetical protein